MDRFAVWMRNEFNIIDFFMLTVAIIGFVLHMGGETSSHWWARTLYAWNAIVFFLRFMRALYINESLGPKLVMIKKMVRDIRR